MRPAEIPARQLVKNDGKLPRRPSASTPGEKNLARRRYQTGQIIYNERRKVWLGRYREDVIQADGSILRTRPQIILGTKKELPTERLAIRKLDEILDRINDTTYRPTRVATVSEFSARWRREVLVHRKPSTIRSANSHLDSKLLPLLGNLRLDQIGPENQQGFVNRLSGSSRKSILNILSTFSSMMKKAKEWGYAYREIEIRKLVLPDRGEHVVAPHFTQRQIENIFALAEEPWRTLFITLGLTGLRAGEVLGLKWQDVDFGHHCIQIRRSAWYGKTHSTKTKTSAKPVTLPAPLAAVLQNYRQIWKPNPEGFLFATRNNRPPSSNKVVEYRLWPLLDALHIPRCGLHAFRHTVASLIADAGYAPEVAQRQLRHSNKQTTLGYIHPRDVTVQAMEDVAKSLKLDAVGRETGVGSQYTQ
jgi:integrase